MQSPRQQQCESVSTQSLAKQSVECIASSANPLRVGVLLDTLNPAAWIRRALDEMTANRKLSLGLIFLRDGAFARDRAGKERPCLLFRVYAWLDQKFRGRGEDAFTRGPIMPDDYGESLWVDELGDFELEAIRNAQFDVIVNMASMRTPPEISYVAAHGVWQFESMTATDAAVADELRAYDRDGARTVRQILSARDRDSLYREQNRRYWRRADFLVQQLFKFQESVSSSHDAVMVSDPGVQVGLERPPLRHQSGNLRTAGLLARTIVRGTRNVLTRKLMEPDWFVAVREHDQVPIESSDMSGFRILASPRDRYYADPFLFQEAGTHFVFLEEYSRKESKGVISFFPLPPDNSIETLVPMVALEAEYHLSYPTLFRWQGLIFMMVETSAAGRIEVFRAIDFPGKWERHAVLIDNIVAYDPNIVEYGGKFWLFCSGGCGGENSDLYVFHAETPFGKWRPHTGNPVVSDMRRARPAGRPFTHKGHLYRPGQDCSRIYGGAVVFNRVEVLTETEYREVPAARIDPEWLPGNVGTHSFNQSGKLQVVDGRTMRPRWHQ